jgi:hypothetical protein
MDLAYDGMPLCVRLLGTEMPPATLGPTHVDGRRKS